MNTKDKVILGLLAVAVMLFCAIQFWFLPAEEARQADYARNQTDSLTHDISAIEEYRFPYVGKVSNVGNLFEHLPLGNVSKKYEIDSENCTLTVDYLDTVWNIGEEKVQRDLIYNSVAAMRGSPTILPVTVIPLPATTWKSFSAAPCPIFSSRRRGAMPYNPGFPPRSSAGSFIRTRNRPDFGRAAGRTIFPQYPIKAVK